MLKGHVGLLVGCAMMAVSVATPVPQNYEDTYSIAMPARDSRDGFTIIQTLEIKRDGSATLTTTYEGRRPSNNYYNRVDFGEVLDEVIRRGRATHTGSWQISGSRVKVYLERMNGRRWDTTFEFQRSAAGLAPMLYDRNDYGNRPRIFYPGKPYGGWGSNSGTGGGVRPSQAEGTYSVEFRLDLRNDRVERRLILSRGGLASLHVNYLKGGYPDIISSDIRQYGDLIRYLERDRTLVHTGTWREERGRIIVNLDRFQGRTMRTTIEFVWEGNYRLLKGKSWDRKMYGNYFPDMKK